MAPVLNPANPREIAPVFIKKFLRERLSLKVFEFSMVFPGLMDSGKKIMNLGEIASRENQLSFFAFPKITL